ncbi:MAG: MoxR family ATPase [Euryarchaeota archaeon]|nr:MoxR family ATPase [Euryarchaeota archaeon]
MTDIKPACAPSMASLMEKSIPKIEKDIAYTRSFRELIRTIDLIQQSHLPVLLIGEAGSGKNQSIFCLASEQNRPVIRINCSGDLRTSSLLGRMSPTEEGHFHWQDGMITQAIRYGYWLVLDEINALEADILFSLHGLIDEGRISVANNSEIIDAHPDFRLFATMNPSRYFATKPLNQALLDRMAVVEVDFDPGIDAYLIKRLSLNSDDETSFLKLIDKIRDACKDGQISQNFGHRTIDNVTKLAPLFGLDRAIDISFTSKLEEIEKAAVKTMIYDFTRKLTR